jgi:hypothetical protein
MSFALDAPGGPSIVVVLAVLAAVSLGGTAIGLARR